MTTRSKLKVLIMITVTMSISFFVMFVLSAPFFSLIILAVIWLFHMLYFGFRVKTIKR